MAVDTLSAKRAQLAALLSTVFAPVGSSGGSSGPVTWDSITGKPATFAPTVPIAQTSVTGLVDALAAAVTDTELAVVLADYPDFADLVWANITGKPSSFPPSAHGHLVADVTGLQSVLDEMVTGAELDAELESFVLGNDPRLSNARAPTAHAHVIGDTTGLQAALDAKMTPAAAALLYAAIGHVHAYSSLTGIPATFAPVIGAGATDAVAGNDARLTNARTPTAHTHAITDTTGLQGALDGKAATTHSHTASAISDSTATGRSILTAADAAAVRTASGAEAAGAAAAAVAAHVALADPHTQYALESTVGQPLGLATLGADGVLAAAQRPAGGSGADVKEVTVVFPYSDRMFAGLTSVVVADAGVAALSQVLVMPGADDEWDMDPCLLYAVPAAGSFTVYARPLESRQPVMGSRKINYLVG